MDTSLANTVLRPPVLDGTNYSLWNVKIRYYKKSIDERAWQRVINGWTPPMKIDQDGDSLPEPETEWTADEMQNSNYNSNALNAIFTSVDMNMFSLITNCISAKDVWDTLQRHCEGSESVRRTRLRMLTSKFETMRMEESESILDYDRRLRKIANISIKQKFATLHVCNVSFREKIINQTLLFEDCWIPRVVLNVGDIFNNICAEVA